MNKLTQTIQCNRFSTLITLSLLTSITLITSCSDFIDHPTSSEPSPQPDPATPVVVADPTPVPNPSHGPETDEQKYWRACEAERMWAFNSRLIDVSALRLYQQRNFAPVFNDPGVRQSGIEGWYACVRALEMNGFSSAQ